MERYRLQYLDQHKNLGLEDANLFLGYIEGDFYVKAIRESTDVKAHNKAKKQKYIYSTLHSLEAMRQFIQLFNFDDVQIDGVGIHDCIGLALEDEARFDQRFLHFEKPISYWELVRRPIPKTNVKEIDATAIRYAAWREDTHHILSVIWGEEKAGQKIEEYTPPPDLLKK